MMLFNKKRTWRKNLAPLNSISIKDILKSVQDMQAHENCSAKICVTEFYDVLQQMSDADSLYNFHL